MNREKEKVKVYHLLKNILFFTKLTGVLVLLFLLFRSGFPWRIENEIDNLNYYLKAFIYLSILFVIFSSINLLFDWMEGYLVEKRFNLSSQTLGGWFKDFLKTTMVEFLIFLILGEIFYFFLRITRLWWLPVWIVWFFLTFVLAKIFPYLILPLFFKLRKIEEPSLKETINNLAHAFGIKIKDIWEVDFSRKTKKANAFVTGLGNSKRVVLADNLLARYTPQEIEVVCAHEFAHIKNRDTLKSIFLVGGSLLFMFLFLNLIIRRVADSIDIELCHPRLLPLILLFIIILNFIFTPVRNFFLRRIEEKADESALLSIQSRDSFISCMEKLARDNLSERDPPKWRKFLFYTHPPINERIKKAENYEERRV